MRQSFAALIGHTGHGPVHADLIINYGRRCPTLHIHRQGRHLRCCWGQPHRRRYLSFAGPVSQARGVVCRVWYGPIRWNDRQVVASGIRLQVMRKAVVPMGLRRKLQLS